uniref:Uncharacterized protein n=1 Tax=Leersia perrieri TaxID=77586 RepID=A0A0D9WK01_9ORYZ
MGRSASISPYIQPTSPIMNCPEREKQKERKKKKRKGRSRSRRKREESNRLVFSSAPDPAAGRVLLDLQPTALIPSPPPSPSTQKRLLRRCRRGSTARRTAAEVEEEGGSRIGTCRSPTSAESCAVPCRRTARSPRTPRIPSRSASPSSSASSPAKRVISL